MPDNDPPVNLDKYLNRSEHRYVTYAEGARELGIPYYTFAKLAKRVRATAKTRRSAICDMNIVYRYITRNLKDEGELTGWED